MKVLTPDEMRLMDENCIRHFKVPGILLMENAASAALNHILADYSFSSPLIVCGSGNNGGDGLALARKLHSVSRSPRVLISGSREKMTPESLENLKSLEALEIPLYFNPEDDVLESLFEGSDLIVDALFGTGLNREVQGEKKDLILRINSSPAPVVSLDIPSGLDGASSDTLGCAVKADSTVCFGAPKPGNVLSPGFINNGDLLCSRISFPPRLYDNEKYPREINLPGPLPERDPLGYKNSFGRVLVIGGGGEYRGAPLLAARAAYRSGAGYVTAAVPRSHCSGFSSRCPEAVVKGLMETESGTIAMENLESLVELASSHTAVLLGPGMTGETADLIRELIPRIEKPLLIDADGLGALAGRPELTLNRTAPTVLTPHLGEERRLAAGLAAGTDKDLEEVYGALCVHKGPRTVIGTPGGRRYINLTGNEALGTAGSGDVLSGMTAAFLAQERDAAAAVQKAVLLHGLTADLYPSARESFCAGDIIEMLPETLKVYREKYSSLTETCFGKIQMLP